MANNMEYACNLRQLLAKLWPSLAPTRRSNCGTTRPEIFNPLHPTTQLATESPIIILGPPQGTLQEIGSYIGYRQKYEFGSIYRYFGTRDAYSMGSLQIISIPYKNSIPGLWDTRLRLTGPPQTEGDKIYSKMAPFIGKLILVLMEFGETFT